MITELYTTINLCLFANPDTQTTTSEGLTPGMHTYYEDRLIDNAEPYLVHDQFGDKYPIPKHGGKTIQFRKYSPLSKALTALTEGVTPDGNSLNMSTIEATVSQYGDYVTCSDVLELTHIDPQIEQATKLLGSQAGRTLDTITRDVITAGTNVMYAPKVSGSTVTEVLSRSALDKTAQLTYDLIFKAVAKLKSMNANPVGDSFVAIVHPNVACDLMLSDKWIGVHQYANPENMVHEEMRPPYGIPMVAVYILGHRVGNIEVPVLYTNHKSYDYEGHEVTKGLPDPFLDSLTHDSIIVQIPLLHGQINNRLEKVLSVFDQTNKEKADQHIVQLDDAKYHDDPDMQYILHRLAMASGNAQLRQDMNVEDEYFKAIEDRDTAIMSRDKIIKEKDQQISQKNQQISQKNQLISQKDQQISQQSQLLDRVREKLRKQGLSEDEIKKWLEK